MIDTIELKYYFEDKIEFSYWYKRISEIIKKNYNRNFNKHTNDKNIYLYKTTAFYNQGFLEISLNIQKNDFRVLWSISMKYKPALVIYPNDKYALMQFKDIGLVENNFNKFIDYLNPVLSYNKLPYLGKWQVIRIDYAFQFFTEKYVEYIKLIHKCHIPYGVKKRFYDTSIGIYRKNTNLNIYDKTIQLGLNDYRHIIRFEVQCLKGYLQHLKEKNQWKSISLYKLWDLNIAYNILHEKVISLMGVGDFEEIKIAVNKIERLYSVKKSEKLKKLLEISRHHNSRMDSIPLIYSINNNCSENYVQKSLMIALKKLRINLLVIPSSWNIRKLEGLDSICDNYFGKCKSKE